MNRLYRSILMLVIPLLGAVAAETTIEHPLLWRIPGEPASWCFGTIHLPDPAVTTLHPLVEEALQSADAVYTEIPLDVDGMTAMVRATRLPDGQTLSALLPDDLELRLDRELRRINPMLGLQMFETQKIWVVMAALTMLEQQFKHPGKSALDQQLWRRASEAEHQEARALETVDEQIQVFDSLSTEEQITLLQLNLDMMDRMRADGRDAVGELIALYRSGRTDGYLDSMYEWMPEGDPLTDRLMATLLTDRNLRMADRIAERLQAEPDTAHFFAVGAAHFADGPDGIPALLAERGIILERIMPPPPAD